MFNSSGFLDVSVDMVVDETYVLVQAALDSSRGNVYLFGRNDLSAQLGQLIEFEGYIDDYAASGSSWQKKPVFTLEDVPKNAIVINCVTNSRPRSAHLRIRSEGFSHVLAYMDLAKVAPNRIPLPNFVAISRQAFAENREKVMSVYESLADEESKVVFNDVLRYRTTGEHAVLANYEFRPHEQYFEDFMCFENEVFVDAGGFDGYTTEQFCLRYPTYKKVYFLEPDPANMAQARKNLSEFKAIQFIQKGISDECGSCFFSSNQGSASVISTDGDVRIELTTIDVCIEEKVTFIKMDLEGYELQALAGCHGHIAQHHPKLAIAVYHDPSDFWKVFEFVMSIRKDYKVFLRHYTESWTETVMYFLPV